MHHAAQPIRWIAIDDLGGLAFPRANRHLIDRLIDRLIEHERNPTLF